MNVTPVVVSSDSELRTLLARPLTVVTFTSITCGPCRLFKPQLKLLATKFGARITFIEADQDAAPDHLNNIINRTGQMGFPLVAFYRNGELIDTFVGFKPLAKTTQYVEAIIS